MSELAWHPSTGTWLGLTEGRPYVRMANKSNVAKAGGETLARKEAPNAVPCAVVLFLHGTLLLCCGCYGAHSHGWAKAVMHSAYAGIGSCIALWICAAMTVSGLYKLYMIGVHIALLLQGIFILVFPQSNLRPASLDDLFVRITGS